jgi:superfamily II DNA or RNA helicase
VNPWSVEPVVITSIDFIKQPEILRAATSVLWDIVIIDEAHQAAIAPRRAAAVKMLASRARHVVLVTATPHSGDDVAYRSLCAIGQIGADDPLLIFRRGRETIGLNRTRKVRLLRVKPGPYELEMHRLLAQYAKRLWQIGGLDTDAAVGARLVAMVFSKRAMSSASSLAISLEKRLAGLSGRIRIARQSGLPFGSDEDESESDNEPPLAVPAFERVDDEERALRAILAAAEHARESETKIAALQRLLRRVREPVVVFTEYRDTLAMLERRLRSLRKIAMLHGGLSAAERDDAVGRFNAGASDLLLATDAGAEGLNLQSRCRLVVNLELPWNPSRLEQRIGRVDRLGQSRTVHAIHLFADGTAEATVLTNLHNRLRRIRASEMDIAACVIEGSDMRRYASDEADTIGVKAQISAEAQAEARRLASLARGVSGASCYVDHGHTAVTVFRSRNRTAPITVWFFHARIVNGCGRLVEDVIIPVQLPLSAADLPDLCSSPPKRRDVKAAAVDLVERFRGAVTAVAQVQIERRVLEIAGESRAWVARALARERRLSHLVATGDPLFQAGLFETRSLTHREDIRQRRQRLVDETATRAGYLALDTVASLAQPPALVLLLIRC